MCFPFRIATWFYNNNSTNSYQRIQMTNCPNCEQQLDVAGWCKICEEYYYGNCPICNKNRTGELWCQQCEAHDFQKNFRKWTSGNKDIDLLIQQSQIDAKQNSQVWEWIPYTQFTNIRYLDKGGFSTVKLATWLDGPRDVFNRDNQRVERRPNEEVVLKILHQSQNIDTDFLKELGSNYACRLAGVGWIFGITKDPTTNEFVMVIRYYEKGDLRRFLKQNEEHLTWREKLLMLHYVASALMHSQNEFNDEWKQFCEADNLHYNLSNYSPIGELYKSKDIRKLYKSNDTGELYKSKDITSFVETIRSSNFEVYKADNLQHNTSSDELYVSKDITCVDNSFEHSDPA
ncbi:23540_t:CDS:2 [Dentiscutata erythropus]|uniref:23540_t:CDS:1 n=1 Tax=Dentiscutata erythropus TaxID=1348616 RepID=A0A9N8VB20_9GLOM|nr:23540_t:CDS:2 [Dentiscutata erythropus]